MSNLLLNGPSPEKDAATPREIDIQHKREVVARAIAHGHIPQPPAERERLIVTGEPVNEAQRQRIKVAEAAVIAALETIPRPSDPEQLPTG